MYFLSVRRLILKFGLCIEYNNGDVRMDDVMIGLIKAFAPSVAEKILSAISGKKIKKDEMNIILVALLAEQNYNTSKTMHEMSKQMTKLSIGMNNILKEIKTINEGIAVLLKRTES